jgi:hypothetical protein
LLPNVWKHLLWKPLLYGIMRDVLYDALILVDYSLICNEAGVDKTDCSLVHTLVSRLITTHDVISEAKSKVEVISPFLPNLKALEGREVYLVAATFRPETLNIKEYLKAFSPFIELKPARFVSEASRGLVLSSSTVVLLLWSPSSMRDTGPTCSFAWLARYQSLKRSPLALQGAEIVHCCLCRQNYMCFCPLFL